jgi:hypothetical protein
MAKNAGEHEAQKLASNDGPAATKQQSNAPEVKEGNQTANVSPTNTQSAETKGTQEAAVKTVTEPATINEGEAQSISDEYGANSVTASRGKGKQKETRTFTAQAWKLLGDGNREGWTKDVATPPEVLELEK